MEAVFAWFGGKRRLCHKLLRLVPNHSLYVEVFGGAASLLLAKQPSPVEVYNDIDGRLVNFFRVVRDEEKLKRLALMLELTPYSRIEHDLSTALLNNRESYENLDDVERAYWFLYNIRTSFGGLLGRNFSYNRLHSRRGISAAVSAYLSAVDGLFELHRRLRGVQVECLDWRGCLSKYEDRHGFFYLDPPYHPETRAYPVYDYEMGVEDHEELVERLLGFRGLVLLSGYANSTYSKLEVAGWRRLEFGARSTVRAAHGSGAINDDPSRFRVETVWMNYDLGRVNNVGSSDQPSIAELAG